MRVSIVYFRPSGKYYTTDVDIEWPEDPAHYTKWAEFKNVRRIKNMFAVCIDSPLGFPQFCSPELQ